MSANDGGPAFPFVVHGSISEHQAHDPGMTLRDWFAGQALAAIIREEGNVRSTTNGVSVQAIDAYWYADAMLRARAEKGVGT